MFANVTHSKLRPNSGAAAKESRRRRTNGIRKKDTHIMLVFMASVPMATSLLVLARVCVWSLWRWKSSFFFYYFIFCVCDQATNAPISPRDNRNSAGRLREWMGGKSLRITCENCEKCQRKSTIKRVVYQAWINTNKINDVRPLGRWFCHYLPAATGWILWIYEILCIKGRPANL